MQLCELWKVTNTFVNVFCTYIVEFWHFTQKNDLLNEMCRNTIYEENHLQNFLYVNCHILNSDSLHSKF